MLPETSISPVKKILLVRKMLQGKSIVLVRIVLRTFINLINPLLALRKFPWSHSTLDVLPISEAKEAREKRGFMGGPSRNLRYGTHREDVVVTNDVAARVPLTS